MDMLILLVCFSFDFFELGLFCVGNYGVVGLDVVGGCLSSAFVVRWLCDVFVEEDEFALVVANEEYEWVGCME